MDCNISIVSVVQFFLRTNISNGFKVNVYEFIAHHDMINGMQYFVQSCCQTIMDML